MPKNIFQSNSRDLLENWLFVKNYYPIIFFLEQNSRQCPLPQNWALEYIHLGSTRECTTWSETQWLNDTTNRLKIHHAANPLQRHVAMNNFPVPSRSKGRSHLQISLMTRRYVGMHMYMLQRECAAPSHVSDQTRMESDDELEQGSETFKIGWFVGVDLETQRIFPSNVRRSILWRPSNVSSPLRRI